jgi:hypothetical protein
MAESNVVPTQDQGDTIGVNLQSNIKVNGVLYPRGMNVKVPKKQADDIARMDYEATQAQMNLVRQSKEYMAPMGQDPRI